jgi:hypothetical protein
MPNATRFLQRVKTRNIMPLSSSTPLFLFERKQPAIRVLVSKWAGGCAGGSCWGGEDWVATAGVLLRTSTTVGIPTCTAP